MTTPTVLHPNGVWLKNTGRFPLYDPEGLVVVPPGVPVKAKHTAWLKAQPTIELTDDPWPAPAPTAAPVAAPSKKA